MKKPLACLILLFLILCNIHCTANDLETLNYDELDSLIQLSINKGNYQKGITYAETGRVKARIEFGERDSTYANFTGHLAVLYRYLGRYKKAEQLHLESLKLIIETQGKKHPNYVAILHNLAVLYQETSHYAKAEHLYKESLKIILEQYGEYHEVYLSSLNNLALFYQFTGQYDDAEALFRKSLKKNRNLSDNKSSYVITLDNLAILYKEMGQYEQAESLHLEALKIRADIFGKSHHFYAASLNNLAILYKVMGRYKEAERLYIKVIDIVINLLGKSHPYYATSLNNLAVLYKVMGQFERAEPMMLEVKKLIQSVFGKNHSYYASSVYNLANLYEHMNRFNQAEKLYLESLNIYIKLNGVNHPSIANSLNILANFYKKNKKIDKTWKYINKVIGNLTQQKVDTMIHLAWFDQLNNYTSFTHFQLIELEKALDCLYDLLTIENKPKNSEKQMLVAKLAMRLLKRIRDSFISDQDKLRLLTKSHDWMLRYLHLLDLNHAFEQAFAVVEFHKSVLLLEATNAAKVYELGHLPDSLADHEQHLQLEQAELNALLLKKLPSNQKDSIRVLLNQLNLKISLFKKQIEQAYPNYAQLKYQTTLPKIDEIKGNLAPNQALLEYVTGDSVVYVFYIDKFKTQATKLQMDGAKLNDQIETFHRILNNFAIVAKDKQAAYENYTKSAYWCYNNLLKPILDEATNIDHLIIIPDGELGHLPYEAFLTQKAPAHQDYSQLDYLIKKYSVSYHYAASLWKENKMEAPRDNNQSIFAMAAQYKINSDTTVSRSDLPIHEELRNKLSPLPAAQLEVELLAKEYRGFFGFDSLATEKEFKQHVKNYGIIHLAMHSWLNENSPTLSGLFFTEDHGNENENNLLQAYEISKLELHADLVVLSACETGYGKFEKGNGIASLARAFMYAGVPSLVVSLWQVEDLATAKIMKHFYSNLASGMDKAEAIRQAKLTFINNAKGQQAHPAYWSPFIQIGDSKPITIHRKIAISPWYFGLFFLLLVVGMVYWRRKSIFK